MSSDFMCRVEALSQISQQKLVNILDSIAGKKDIVIEPSLMKPLERFIGVTALRSHGVDKIFKLDKTGQQANSTLVYLIRGDLITAKHVCDQINSSLGVKPDIRFHVIFVPRLLVPVELLFEEEGLIGKVSFHVLAWELIQLDSKILSFECPEIYKQLFMDNNQSLLPAIARSLWSVQHVFGKVPLSLYHGKYSCIISKMMSTWDAEMGEPDKLDSDIGCMLVIDRDTDYASPLLIPGTYTSLVHDIMNLKTGIVEIKKGDPEKKELPVSMLLTSEDEVYNQIKNKHFSDIFIFLKNKASTLNSDFSKRHTMGIKEMKDFVKNDLSKTANLGKALSNHINICERVTVEIGQKFESLQMCQENILEGVSRREVISYIEDVIASTKDKILALRLICLLSIAQNGFSHEEANSIKSQFFHAHGYENLTTFHNLEKAGLFLAFPSLVPSSITETAKLASKVASVVSLPKKCAFQTVAQKLKLFPDTTKDYSLKDPQDLGYVFGGAYIPVIAQLINYLIKKEMCLGELSKCLPGNLSGKAAESIWLGKSLDSVPDINPRAILVYVVGGITYAEIAAMQLIEKKTGCRILCCGSSIVNSNIILGSAE